MVLKNIARIQKAMPEVTQIVMFYNDGTVFQTTFEQQLNIPKIGQNLAEALEHMRTLFDTCSIEMREYRKLIFETDDFSVIVLKLGENSNLALFFKKEMSKEIKLQPIRRYIAQIEELIDMDQIEVEMQILEEKQKEIDDINGLIKQKTDEIDTLNQNLQDPLKTQEESKNITEKINLLKTDIDDLNKELSGKNAEILIIKEKIKSLQNQ